MTLRRIALVLVVSMMSLGCIHTPPQVVGPPPEMSIEAPGAPSGKALMTFYRQRRFVGALLNTSVFIDGVEIADLDNGTYVTTVVDPGRRKVYSDEANDALWVDVMPGREYFFRINIDLGVWKGNGRLIPVPGESGRTEFTTWKMKRGKDIRVPEMVIDSPSLARVMK